MEEEEEDDDDEEEEGQRAGSVGPIPFPPLPGGGWWWSEEQKKEAMHVATTKRVIGPHVYITFFHFVCFDIFRGPMRRPCFHRRRSRWTHARLGFIRFDLQWFLLLVQYALIH